MTGVIESINDRIHSNRKKITLLELDMQNNAVQGYDYHVEVKSRIIMLNDEIVYLNKLKDLVEVGK